MPEDPRVVELTATIDETVSCITKMQNKLDEFERIKNEAEQNIMLADRELAAVNARIHEAGRARGAVVCQSNPFTDQAKELRDGRLKIAKMEHAAKTKEKAKLERQAVRREFWVKGFQVIRLQIVEEVLAELQLATNAVLAEIGMERWRVEYAVSRETQAGTVSHGFNVLIHSPHNDKPVKWEVWSGGEGQRLRIAGALALSDVLLARYGVDCDLRIFDEPSTWMAGEGVDDMIELLADRAETRDLRIYFIDHRVAQSASFSSVIKLVKDGHGTRIEG